MPMHGRDRPGVSQAQLVILPDTLLCIRVVQLVHDEEHGLSRSLEQARHLFVVGLHADAPIHHEQDHISLVLRFECLSADGLLEVVISGYLDATGVHQHEMDAVPIRLVIAPITRDAAHLMHDGVACLGDLVHERGLPHIRTSYYCNKGQCHISYPPRS